jgi:PAS domain S-box-containing protein
MSYRLEVSADLSQRRFLHVSESCLALNGVTAQEAMADPQVLYRLVAPEHRQRFAEAERQAMATGAALDIEVPFRLPDGRLRWTRIASVPSPGEAGATVWDGIQVDITGRKRLEEELSAERQRLNLAVEATGLGLWEMNLRTRELIWSEQNRYLHGLPPGAEVDANNSTRTIHLEDRPQVEDAFKRVQTKQAGGDFSADYRVVLPDGGVRWLRAYGRMTLDDGGPGRLVGGSLDITVQKSAEERQNLLIGEFIHRAKNGIAVILAIMQQTARSVDSVAAFEDLFGARLTALGEAQGLMVAGELGQGHVRFGDLVRKVLEPFGLSRFDIDPALDGIAVSVDTGGGLALLTHELATNAMKYGALTAPDGRVSFARGASESGMACVIWRERGGPAVVPPTRSGFGARLLKNALAAEGGAVEARYPPEGFEATLRFPLQAGEPAFGLAARF